MRIFVLFNFNDQSKKLFLNNMYRYLIKRLLLVNDINSLSNRRLVVVKLIKVTT